MKLKKAIKMLSALSQDTRLEIFRLLIKEGPEGLPAGVIAEILEVPSATLSFHLTQLSNAGLIVASKTGRSISYSAKYKSIKKLMRFVLEGSYQKRIKENNAKEDKENYLDITNEL